MKINSMKLTIIISLLVIFSGIIYGLFFVEIPTNNADVFYLIIGSLLATIGTAILNMFKKE